MDEDIAYVFKYFQAFRVLVVYHMKCSRSRETRETGGDGYIEAYYHISIIIYFISVALFMTRLAFIECIYFMHVKQEKLYLLNAIYEWLKYFR